MTHPIIKTENYLLVVDDKSEIKNGDWIFSNEGSVAPTFLDGKFLSKEHLKAIWLKIIYHLPLNNAPILEGVPLLPPLEDDESICPYPEEKQNAVDWHNGYNKAREKYRYTEEDIDKAYWAGMKFVGEDKGSYKEFIQSLQQPKYPVAFECEMVLHLNETWSTELGEGILSKPKTITNSQGLTQVVGKYIY